MIEVFMVLSSIATIVIAVYAVKAHHLSNEIKRLNEHHEQDMKDLSEAIAISNMVSLASGGMAKHIKDFKKYYKGKRNIFNDEAYKG